MVASGPCPCMMRRWDMTSMHVFRDNSQDLYLPTAGNSTNQVIKVLAIIATIFIPLTFIAGVAMTFYFKRKKWL